MQLPKDLAADAVVAVQSSSTATLAIAAADRIPCGRDAVAAADAADASDRRVPHPSISVFLTPPFPSAAQPSSSPPLSVYICCPL